MGKLVYGIGINDHDGPVTLWVENKTVVEKFYYVWSNMIKRCYVDEYIQLRPTYERCEVHNEWLSLSTFKKWYDENYITDYCLDKDLLFTGNTLYGPDTCVFLPPAINSFMVTSAAIRGEYPLGVNKRGNRFQSTCSNPFSKKGEHLGYFSTPIEAHEAWRVRKLAHAKDLAELYKDTLSKKAYDALIGRYKEGG